LFHTAPLAVNDQASSTAASSASTARQRSENLPTDANRADRQPECDYDHRDKSIPQVALAADSKCVAAIASSIERLRGFGVEEARELVP
jgi:hypothetical protein